MIRTESMEELMVKLQTWKSLMKMKGLWVIMVWTEIMVSGINSQCISGQSANRKRQLTVHPKIVSDM